jgi:hypothetical protein
MQRCSDTCLRNAKNQAVCISQCNASCTR